MIRTATILLLAAAATAAAGGPDRLTRTITTTEGRVQVAYPRRQGVEVDRDHLIVRDGHLALDDGLVHVALQVDDGTVERVEARSGRPARPEAVARDLGEVSAGIAATCFFALAEGAASAAVAEDALTAAALADTVTWPRLLPFARDRERPQQVREAAIFWLGMAAGEKVERELVAIVDDDSEEIEIREHAVFALNQACGDDAAHALATLGPIATGNPHPQVRRSALFWLAQHDDPAVVDLFERILLD